MKIMKKNIKIFLVLSIICILIFFLTGCNNNKYEEDVSEKVIQELDYLDTQISDILINLNNMSFRNYTLTSEEIQMGKESLEDEQKESKSMENENSESQNTNVTITQMKPQGILQINENEIDWEMIKAKTETLNEVWGVVVLDLTSVSIDNNDILGFSNTINSLILSVKDEDKKEALRLLAKLYSFIPKFENGVAKSKGTKKLKEIKSYLVNAYSLVEDEDWEQIETNINQADEVYKNIINDLEYIKNKEYKINKIYVLIKELQNSLVYKDKKLFYIKYKNLMENLDTL